MQYSESQLRLLISRIHSSDVYTIPNPAEMQDRETPHPVSMTDSDLLDIVVKHSCKYRKLFRYILFNPFNLREYVTNILLRTPVPTVIPKWYGEINILGLLSGNLKGYCYQWVPESHIYMFCRIPAGQPVFLPHEVATVKVLPLANPRDHTWKAAIRSLIYG